MPDAERGGILVQMMCEQSNTFFEESLTNAPFRVGLIGWCCFWVCRCNWGSGGAFSRFAQGHLPQHRVGVPTCRSAPVQGEW